MNVGFWLVIYARDDEFISVVCADEDLNVQPVGRKASMDVKVGDMLLRYAVRLSAFRCQV